MLLKVAKPCIVHPLESAAPAGQRHLALPSGPDDDERARPALLGTRANDVAVRGPVFDLKPGAKRFVQGVEHDHRLVTFRCAWAEGGEPACQHRQPFTCTAAPICAPATREIVGVLDLSGSYKLVRPHLIGVVMQAALEIEERLALL